MAKPVSMAKPPKLGKDEEDKFIGKVKEEAEESAKKRKMKEDPLIFNQPEFKKAAWSLHCFYVFFLGFFCLQEPTDTNIMIFAWWCALGFLLWLRYSVFA